MSVLKAEKISISLGETNVVHDVDLAIGAGEMIGLIGPNGAGKTTLLRGLCGLLPIDAGTVCLNDVAIDVIERRELARSIAYLPQSGQSHWSISVETFVSLGRLPHRGPWSGLSTKDRNAIAHAMEVMDVSKFAKRETTKLSGGEFSRVMLARVWAGEPKILLADEPVSDLDPYHRLEVMEHLQLLTRQGAAVIVVLHDLTLAARFCTRLALFDSGRLVRSGPPDKVLSPDYLARIYRVNAITGNNAGQPYIIPWDRVKPVDKDNIAV